MCASRCAIELCAVRRPSGERIPVSHFLYRHRGTRLHEYGRGYSWVGDQPQLTQLDTGRSRSGTSHHTHGTGGATLCVTRSNSSQSVKDCAATSDRRLSSRLKESRDASHRSSDRPREHRFTPPHFKLHKLMTRRRCTWREREARCDTLQAVRASRAQAAKGQQCSHHLISDPVSSAAAAMPQPAQPAPNARLAAGDGRTMATQSDLVWSGISPPTILSLGVL